MSIIVRVDDEATGPMKEHAGKEFVLIPNMHDSCVSINVEGKDYVIGASVTRAVITIRSDEFTWLELQQLRIVSMK